MIDVFELVTWILAGVAIVLIGGFLLYMGSPSTIPKIGITVAEVQDLKKSMSKDQIAKLDAVIKIANKNSGASGSSRSGLKKVKTRNFRITRHTYDRVRNLADAFREAKEVSSEVKINEDGTSSLKIFGIPETSPLAKFGFKDNDLIESIGGERQDFQGLFSDAGYQARGLFSAMRDRMENGEPLVIDIKRAGKLQRVVIALQNPGQ